MLTGSIVSISRKNREPVKLDAVRRVPKRDCGNRPHAGNKNKAGKDE